MSSNPTMNFRDSAFVRKTGLSALRKELGAAGAAYFIRQFSAGRGDYTTERDVLLRGITLDEIVKRIRKTESGPVQD